MRARTVGELIAQSYTATLEDFMVEYPDPVLIGVGILDVRLFQDANRHNNTLALSLDPLETKDGQPRHHLMGVLVPIRAPDGSPWTRLALGRTEENDVVLDDPAVSEFHGYFKAREEDIILGDLGSTNGTKVNGTPLRPPQTHVLVNEDVLTFGRCSFQFFRPASLFEYLNLGVD